MKEISLRNKIANWLVIISTVVGVTAPLTGLENIQWLFLSMPAGYATGTAIFELRFGMFK